MLVPPSMRSRRIRCFSAGRNSPSRRGSATRNGCSLNATMPTRLSSPSWSMTSSASAFWVAMPGSAL
jgi:hypothetical protein